MQTLLKGWNVMRVLRLAIGIMAIIQAYQQGSWALAIAGFFVVILAIANLGCCGAAGCNVKSSRREDNSKNEIVYEELGK
ncbi:hypothetical protein FRZ67_09195 [Panacibacter ginsenosidivorans]|uniref:DUF2892 domain-containing protein n=1 Tax=Panacibacter ginsenosidivorans TaxID=1813871 RepID=A0A5B8V9D1_9BACT|nr:hypothetical protein [Panacibacter ginsenosidivorans]QEC67461.1 hypothetical protein FRZ67_09195 [Panacibacter ginsenosidivorans]